MLKPTNTAPRTIRPPTITITLDHRLRVHGPSATSIVIEAIAPFLPTIVRKNHDSAGWIEWTLGIFFSQPKR
jgi:hypothetical protein